MCGVSAQAVSKSLDIELVELEDWNCCGSTPYGAVDNLAALCVATRNLALAERRHFDLVTPCSSCYITLNRAHKQLKEHPRIKSRVDKALAAAKLEYGGSIRVKHLAEVLFDELQNETFSARVINPLKGLKVAPYYGCQLVRPGYGFDACAHPQSLDFMIGKLGAEAVPFPLKSRCCGGSLIISEEDIALKLIAKLLKNAREHGAQCIITPCPLCQLNLDAYQDKINRKFNTHFDLPVLYFTQLIGVALGLSSKLLALEKNIVSPMKVLSAYVH
jgi:heterodisulfide reductase subunit B